MKPAKKRQTIGQLHVISVYDFDIYAVGDVTGKAVADLENEKGWFQFIVALARRKIFVGHAHFGSREDTYL